MSQVFIGNSDNLAFELKPLEPSWSREAPVDCGPWAELGVFVRGHCLTRFVEPQTRRERLHVNIPLLALANWFVENIRAVAFEENPALFRGDIELHETLARWSRARKTALVSEDDWEDKRFEWYTRHFWLSGSEGANLPDVAWVRSDERLWVSWRPWLTAGARPIEFLEASGCEAIEWSVALEAIELFVEYVRSETAQSESTGLAWLNSTEPIRKALKCTAQEFVELVAPRASEIIHDLGLDNTDPDSSAPLLALRDLEVVEGYDAAKSSLERLIVRLNADEPAKPDRHSWRTRLQTATSSIEEAGHEAAREVRREVGLDGEPIADDKLNEILLGLAKLETVETPARGNQTVIGALRDGPAAVVFCDNERTSRYWVRRFELARAIGHLLLDRYTACGALGAGSSRAAAGPRRRRSGAFAAELLMPRGGIESCLADRDPADGEVFKDLIQHFRIGASAAAYQLWNEGFLVHDEDRDSLIEEYSASAES